eukprot:gene22638-biopygen19130
MHQLSRLVAAVHHDMARQVAGGDRFSHFHGARYGTGDGARDPVGAGNAQQDGGRAQRDQQQTAVFVARADLRRRFIEQPAFQQLQLFQRCQVDVALDGHVAFVQVLAPLQVACVLGLEHLLAHVGIGFSRAQHLLVQGLLLRIQLALADVVLDFRGACGRGRHFRLELFLMGGVADFPGGRRARRIDFDDLGPFADQALIAHLHVDEGIRFLAGTLHLHDAHHGQGQQQQQDCGKPATETHADLEVFHSKIPI